ncbi:MAG: hypothetical protein JWQ28_2988, partial [Pedobacter sp.]|nr:hypothetical protein [Pedobacter sp.]
KATVSVTSTSKTTKRMGTVQTGRYAIKTFKNCMTILNVFLE